MANPETEFERRTGGEEWVPYWAAGRRRELRFQRCASCRTWRFPPQAMCAACHSLEHEWALASGKARLLSWVVVHPPVLPAWKERTPYVVVLVESEEGCRTMGNLLGASAADLRMDMALAVEFAPSIAGDLVPQWRPGEE
jgi:uncharacterized OB-fold protein